MFSEQTQASALIHDFQLIRKSGYYPEELDFPQGNNAVDTLINRAAVSEITQDYELLQGKPRYKLLSKIAEGGIGQVWLAEDLPLGRLCAIKTTSPNLEENMWELAEQALELEAVASARIACHHLLVVHNLAFHTQNGKLSRMMISEYLDPKQGWGTLKEWQRKLASIHLEDAYRILSHVVIALEKTRAHGIIHRDLKPENIMINGEETKLIDFGLAKPVWTDTADQFFGTLSYMAPETIQCKSKGDTLQEEVFSLGTILFELFSKKTFWNDGEYISYWHQSFNLNTLEKIQKSGLSPELQAFLLPALQPNPADRYQSPRAMLEAFDQIVIQAQADSDSPFSTIAEAWDRVVIAMQSAHISPAILSAAFTDRIAANSPLPDNPTTCQPLVLPTAP